MKELLFWLGGAFVGLGIGLIVSSEKIARDCDMLGKVRIAGIAYECKQIK